MKKDNLIRNPYLLFSPFLIFFIAWICSSPPDGTFGDQDRYLWFAQNLINGFYSPPAPDIDLTNGPGYPILLVPFLLLKLPLITITLMNAFFYYFSIILLYKSLKEIVSINVALTFSLAWASYYIAYQNIPYIHTETFTYLLVSILIFSILKAFKPGHSGAVKKYVILSGFILGYVVLTKMIFGYVLLIMLVGSALTWMLNRKNTEYRKSFFILVLALITTAPYLLYTQQIPNIKHCASAYVVKILASLVFSLRAQWN